MIIKFQIYSILHPIPSKGMLESHANVLLNRNGIFKFYFTFFFPGAGKRETSLQPTFVTRLGHPRPKRTFLERFTAAVLRAPVEGPGPTSPGLRFSSHPLFPFQNGPTLISPSPFLPGVRTGGSAAEDLASSPGPTTNCWGPWVNLLTSLASVFSPVTRERVGLDSRRAGWTLPGTFQEGIRLQRVNSGSG